LLTTVVHSSHFDADIMIARGVLRECLADLDKLYTSSEPK